MTVSHVVRQPSERLTYVASGDGVGVVHQRIVGTTAKAIEHEGLGYLAAVLVQLVEGLSEGSGVGSEALQ